MNPMNPMNQKFVDLCKDTNISAEQALERFDLNLERLNESGADSDREEDVFKTLDVLSKWLEEALAKGMTMQELQPRAKELAKCAFDKGCSQAEVQELLTMHPKD